jgi:hypothetical protein
MTVSMPEWATPLLGHVHDLRLRVGETEMISKSFRNAMLLKWNNQLPIHLEISAASIKTQNNGG